MIRFDVSVDQNEYLPAGGRVMHAVVSVTASGGDAPAPSAAQVIMLDSSTSMSGNKIDEAKKAAAVAIDTLRDGVAFAIVAGTVNATMLYPAEPLMVPATATTREEARAALRELEADGGTAIGVWLELAAGLLDREPAEIKHAILLTDGRNEHQTLEELRAVLEACRGRFVCDGRGVGRRWEAQPLVEIADALLGSAVGLPEPGELAADFQAITEAVMGKAAANVSLRLWTLPDARIRFVKQMYPRIVDLTDRGVPSGPRSVDYPTGQWGDETRDFHVCVEIPPGTLNDEIRVAKVGMVAGGDISTERPILVRWTDDPLRSTRISTRVAHYSGQADLANAIEQGIEARARGDVDIATAKLADAVHLAQQTGDTLKLRQLDKIVERDPAGTLRLRANTLPVDIEMASVTARATLEVRSRKEPPR
jgi:hypothetical protein